MTPRTRALGFGALVLCALALAGRDLERPGLYYDEVIQAEPAVQFLDPAGEPSHIPGASSAHVFGRWLPLMVQPYMGALKSQLLVPVFAAFGATATSLRLATLGFALLGLCFFAAFAQRIFSLPVALLAGGLLAVDPSFLFVSRHDWGSFALGFLCRCAALYSLTTGHLRGSGTRLFVGGLCIGAGLYNKIDFAIFPAAAGCALLLAHPTSVGQLLRAPRKLAAGFAGLLLGAAPLLAAWRGVASAADRFLGRRGGTADWEEKLSALTTTLDGSYFHRLMLTGGSFEAMPDASGAATDAFLVIFAACCAGLLVWLARNAERRRTERGAVFALAAALLSLVFVLLTPRAVRIHHVLNVFPFPQLVVALALVTLWRRGAKGARLVAAGTAAVALCGSLWVDARTLDTIHTTGGRGRWSDSITAFARELEAEPGALAVSLDWGFDGPLRFATRDLHRMEPIWWLRNAHRPGQAWSHGGGPGHVYLVFDEEYAVFDFGPRFLERVRELPADRVAIRRHDDRGGAPAFYSVRFAHPHQLVYRGRWEISDR